MSYFQRRVCVLVCGPRRKIPTFGGRHNNMYTGRERVQPVKEFKPRERKKNARAKIGVLVSAPRALNLRWERHYTLRRQGCQECNNGGKSDFNFNHFSTSSPCHKPECTLFVLFKWNIFLRRRREHVKEIESDINFNFFGVNDARNNALLGSLDFGI